MRCPTKGLNVIFTDKVVQNIFMILSQPAWLVNDGQNQLGMLQNDKIFFLHVWVWSVVSQQQWTLTWLWLAAIFNLYGGGGGGGGGDEVTTLQG